MVKKNNTIGRKEGQNKESIKKNTRKDILLWVLIITAIVVGVVANFRYSEVAWALRLAAWIVLAGILGLIALQTSAGNAFWAFAKAARLELRKVVWPTRQETVQTTTVVIGLVILVAMILWGVDALLMWATKWVTG